ncbi:SUMF1/EgtB/PvdO family nonheme iron enzyme [uncultured Thiodictyon sp.]|uniref:SUMF1/EgtB/PvdO family nonheme iron enzyme n=1 Tax=uncultured Thiodictyon sp. TaxID=1846217 RepID=UPI0025CC03F8|nr:SUMF1/EgtB/PvdO family nonheme iron enzyme [uncultured Thiodictyon sp.]
MWEAAAEGEQENPVGPVAAASVTADAEAEALRIRAQLGALQERAQALDDRLRAQLRSRWAVGEGGGAAGAAPSFINGIFVGERSEAPERQLHILRDLAALHTYCLPLRGIHDVQAGPGIGRLYVPLATDLTLPEDLAAQVLAAAAGGAAPPFPAADPGAERIPDQARARHLSACEASILRRSLVILGEPGAGKTTLLAFLAHALATGDRAALPGWPQPEWSCLPLLMRLRDFAAWLAESGDLADAGAAASDALVWGFVRHELAERNLTFCLGALESAVRGGRAVLLWDGLDEVPPGALATVRESLLAFRERAPGCRYVLTSRLLSYCRPERRLPEPDFPVVSLLPFDRDQIGRFVTDWFQELGACGDLPCAEAERLALLFQQGLGEGHLTHLAANPLLLTLLALIFTHRRDLPAARAQVFEAATGILLARLDGPRAAEGPRLRDLLREVHRDRCDLIRWCERLAMRVQSNSERGLEPGAPGQVGVAGVGEAELLESLQALHARRDLEWAQSLVDLIKQRAGLLREERPGDFDFPHRALREYLAGCHLAHDPDFAAQVAALAVDRTDWQETIRHAVGFLVQGQRECARPLALIEHLCPAAAPADDAAWRRVWLAGEVALELGVTRAAESPAGAHTLERVRHRLVALVEAGRLQVGERVAAAAVLGRLGDPRFHPRGLHLPVRYRGEREPALGLVRVRYGSLALGGPADLEGALSNEVGGEGRLELDYAFWIGRYPVTVAQFQAFVAADGYERRDWWPDLGWAWCRGQQRRAPERWAHQRRQSNRPVVGITWFEALAYAAWLDAQLRKRRTELPHGYGLRLPTEAEWALAARGSQGRVYPWGGGFSAGQANCMGSVGEPSAVGIFPLGATPEGVLDLAGNVWEWTLSRYLPYPYDPADGRNDPQRDGARVLRGGSCDAGPLRARTAARARAPLGEAARDIGCRLVLSLADAGV